MQTPAQGTHLLDISRDSSRRVTLTFFPGLGVVTETLRVSEIRFPGIEAVSRTAPDSEMFFRDLRRDLPITGMTMPSLVTKADFPVLQEAETSLGDFKAVILILPVQKTPFRVAKAVTQIRLGLPMFFRDTDQDSSTQAVIRMSQSEI